MNISEAYEFVMNKLEKLKVEGLNVQVKTQPDTQELVDKFKYGHLPQDKWQTITISINGESDLNKVKAIEDLCKMNGIYFDTGFGVSHRDWEIDWSFRLIP